MAKTTKTVTPLKNKALNSMDRDMLLKFAYENVKAPVEQKAFDDAYAKAKPFVLASVHKTYPPADMKVLEKYGAAHKDDCIQFGGGYNRDMVFYFLGMKKDVDAPLVPRYNGCGDRRYDWSAEALKALNAYVLARQKLADTISTKKEDYTRLIRGSRMFDDVVAVWPAAEQFRDKIIPTTPVQRALAVLSEETIARIKKDNAGGK